MFKNGIEILQNNPYWALRNFLSILTVLRHNSLNHWQGQDAEDISIQGIADDCIAHAGLINL